MKQYKVMLTINGIHKLGYKIIEGKGKSEWKITSVSGFPSYYRIQLSPVASSLAVYSVELSRIPNESLKELGANAYEIKMENIQNQNLKGESLFLYKYDLNTLDEFLKQLEFYVKNVNLC